jgi:hypothetical protein
MVVLLNIIAKIKDSSCFNSFVHDNKFLIRFIIIPIVQFAFVVCAREAGSVEAFHASLFLLRCL